MFERYSFVAVTTADLDRARRFWTEVLGFGVTEERPDDFFIVDVGGLRLCIDRMDGDVQRAPGNDPVIGLKVASLGETLARLAERGIEPEQGPVATERGRFAQIRDPDGRIIIITEVD